MAGPNLVLPPHPPPHTNFFKALGALSKKVLDWYGLVMFGRGWVDPPPMAEWLGKGWYELVWVGEAW